MTDYIIRFRAWLSFRRQRHAFARALRITRRYDGLVVSRAAYFAAVDTLAAFLEELDQSGYLTHAKNAQLRYGRGIGNALQQLVNAARLGDPTLQMPEVEAVYRNARDLRKSKRKVRRHAREFFGLVAMAAAQTAKARTA